MAEACCLLACKPPIKSHPSTRDRCLVAFIAVRQSSATRSASRVRKPQELPKKTILYKNARLPASCSIDSSIFPFAHRFTANRAEDGCSLAANHGSLHSFRQGDRRLDIDNTPENQLRRMIDTSLSLETIGHRNRQQVPVALLSGVSSEALGHIGRAVVDNSLGSPLYHMILLLAVHRLA